MSDAGDPREATLREMIEAAQAVRVTGLEPQEASLLLSRVLARARHERARRRTVPAFWFAGLAAGLALVSILAPPPVPPPERVARETVIHLVADGREVFIRAVSYVEEE